MSVAAARRAGLILTVFGLLAAVGSLLPLAAKGGEGVTLLYLARFFPRTFTAELPLALFIVAPAAVIVGLLLARGHLAAHAPWYVIFGIAGFALTMLGIVEGMEHIHAFIGGCGALRFDAASAAPITVGKGALLAVVGYGGMIIGGLWPVR